MLSVLQRVTTPLYKLYTAIKYHTRRYIRRGIPVYLVNQDIIFHDHRLDI